MDEMSDTPFLREVKEQEIGQLNLGAEHFNLLSI
jgi:hypothetical protein